MSEKKLKIFQVWSIEPTIRSDLETYEHKVGCINASYCNSVVIIQKPDSIDKTVLVVPIANYQHSKYAVAISGEYIGVNPKDAVHVIPDKMFHINIDNLKECLAELSISDRQKVGFAIKDDILPRFIGTMLF